MTHQTYQRFNIGAVSFLLIFSLSWSVVTTASDEEVKPRMLEEIVVRALRRSKDSLEVPIQVTALTADNLNSADVLTLEDLDGKIPNTFVSGAGNYGTTTMAIRGVGGSGTVFGEEPIAIFFDDQYLPRAGNASGSLLDLESIEVLRGPQVTLYGRNATGGAVLLRSARPSLTENEGYARISLAEHSDQRYEAAYGGPVSENFALRASGQYTTRDGWADNLTNGKSLDYFESTRGRLTGIWQIDANSELFATIEVSKSESRVANARIAIAGDNSIRIPSAEMDRLKDGKFENDSPHFSEFEDRRASVAWSREFENFELTIDAGYFYAETLGATDSDGTSAALFDNLGEFEVKVFTENIRLVSTGASALEWIVGFSAVQDKYDMPYFFINNYAAVGGLGGDFRFFSGLETTAQSLYGEVAYAFTDRLKVTTGIRATSEKKEVSVDTLFLILSTGGVLVDPPVFEDSEKWTAVKPRLIAEYELSDNTNLYASVSTGFKSGGYNAFGQVPAYDEEDILAYEIGFKGRFFDSRFELSTALFSYEYDNLQLRLGVPTGGVSITNAAGASIEGFEAEWRYFANENLTISGSFAWLDTEFEKYITRDLAGALVDASGNELSRAPRSQYTLQVDYMRPVNAGFELGVSGSVAHRGDVYFRETNQDSRAWSGDALTEVDLRLVIRPQEGSWELAAFVQNATDDVTVVSAAAAGDFPLASFNEPRKVGLQFSTRF